MNSINNRYGYAPSFGNVKVIKEGARKMNYGPINYLNLMDYFNETIGKLNTHDIIKKSDILLGSEIHEPPHHPSHNTIVAYVRNAGKMEPIVSVDTGASGSATKRTTMYAIDKLAHDIKSVFNVKN